jgi:hypothetical protein
MTKAVSHATDHIAEDMAHEILQDAAFRAEIQELIKRLFAKRLHMPLMLSKTYDALKSAHGVSEEQARAAAEEFAELLRVREDLAAIRSEVSGLKWMFGLTWTLLILIMGGMVQILARLPRS